MKRLGLIPLLFAFFAVGTTAVVATGCGGGESTPDATPPDAAIAADETVTLFAATPVHFTVENRRVVDAEVELPAPELRYRKIVLHLTLGCLNGLCDWWDRFGRIAIVQNPGAETETEIEVMRFVTPYRVGMEVTLDVTDLRPILAGPVTARVFIDTWVGPGHANGDGWLVDASLEFLGGEPETRAIAVVPLWTPQGVVYGDPLKEAVLAADIRVPAGARSARLWSFVTGHGQGNAENCAEFCPREHTFTIDGAASPRMVWRDDCATTAAPNQQGTFQYPRAGWCPGALVAPLTSDVTAVTPDGQVSVGWTVATYENTCRPDVTECAGCVFRTGCDYDGGNHTEPNYQVSSAVIFYE